MPHDDVDQSRGAERSAAGIRCLHDPVRGNHETMAGLHADRLPQANLEIVQYSQRHGIGLEDVTRAVLRSIVEDGPLSAAEGLEAAVSGVQLSEPGADETALRQVGAE